MTVPNCLESPRHGYTPCRGDGFRALLSSGFLPTVFPVRAPELRTEVQYARTEAWYRHTQAWFVRTKAWYGESARHFLFQRAASPLLSPSVNKQAGDNAVSPAPLNKTYRPAAETAGPYKACSIRFSTTVADISRLAASGITNDRGPSMTSSVTIIPRRTGRQCMK